MTVPTVALVRDVRESIRHAAEMLGITAAEVGRRAGFTERTWARRMSDGEWTLSNLDAIAHVLGIDVLDLLQGPVHVMETLCAVRDLNPEPADYAEGHLAGIAA